MNRIATLIAGVAAVAGAALCLADSPALKSGVDIGGALSAFHPTHVTGADKGTNTCPVCKYPTNPAVQVWVNTDDTKNVDAIVSNLEKQAHMYAGKKLKAFVVFVNPSRDSDKAIQTRLEKIASAEHVQNVALVYLPGPQAEPVKEYQINADPQVRNTVFVYKNRTVGTKYVNFVADRKGLESLDAAIKTVVE
jgi:protocatechuate 3,4-dioxygenase beta subunit